MISKGLAKYLHNLNLGVYSETLAGATIACEYLPPTPDIITMLRTYTGIATDAKLGYDTYGVQVFVRGANADPRPVEIRAMAAYNALHGIGNVTLPEGTELINCYAMQPPFSLGVDANGRHGYAFNLSCEIRNATVRE